MPCACGLPPTPASVAAKTVPSGSLARHPARSGRGFFVGDFPVAGRSASLKQTPCQVRDDGHSGPVSVCLLDPGQRATLATRLADAISLMPGRCHSPAAGCAAPRRSSPARAAGMSCSAVAARFACTPATPGRACLHKAECWLDYGGTDHSGSCAAMSSQQERRLSTAVPLLDLASCRRSSGWA